MFFTCLSLMKCYKWHGMCTQALRNLSKNWTRLCAHKGLHMTNEWPKWSRLRESKKGGSRVPDGTRAGLWKKWRPGEKGRRPWAPAERHKEDMHAGMLMASEETSVGRSDWSIKYQ